MLRTSMPMLLRYNKHKTTNVNDAQTTQECYSSTQGEFESMKNEIDEEGKRRMNKENNEDLSGLEKWSKKHRENMKEELKKQTKGRCRGNLRFNSPKFETEGMNRLPSDNILLKVNDLQGVRKFFDLEKKIKFYFPLINFKEFFQKKNQGKKIKRRNFFVFTLIFLLLLPTIKTADCSAPNFYSGTGENSETCYDRTGCETLSNHIVDLSTQTCRPLSECVDDSTLIVYTNDEGVKSCILSSNCLLFYKFIVSDNECRDSCTDGNDYFYETENSCYSKLACTNDSKFPLIDSSSNKLCLDENLCNNQQEFSFTEDTKKCIEKADCWTIFGSTQPTCRENSCSTSEPYLKTDTNICYSETQCQEQNFTPLTDSNEKNLCLDQTLCVSHPEFSYNLDSKTCITSSTCSAFIYGNTDKTCLNSCSANLYFNEPSKICYTETECKGNSMKTVEDSNNNLLCLSNDECNSHQEFSFTEDTNKCILTENCKITSYGTKTQICREACPLSHEYFNENSKTCYDGSACTGNLSPIIDSESKKLCLTKEECQNYPGLSFNLDSLKCVKSEVCFLTTEDDSDPEGTCRTNCPPENSYINFEETLCYTKSGCTSSTSKKYPVSSSTRNYCLSEEKCRDLDSFSFNVDSGSCILKESCTRTVYGINDGSCRSECPESDPHLAEETGICYSIPNCQQKSMFPMTTASGSELCLTSAQCKSHLEFSFNNQTEQCIPSSDCQVKEFQAEPGTCRNSCSETKEYLNEASEICYDETQCKSDLKYPIIDSTSKKLCLTQTECRDASGLSFNKDSSTCILTEDCNVKISGEEAGTCRDSCLEGHSFFNERTKTCYSFESCESASMKTMTKDLNKYCLSEADCKDHKEFSFNAETETCILTTSCKVFIFQGEIGTCRDSCPSSDPYIDLESKMCYSASTCKDDNKYEITPGSLKLCLTREECKAYEGYKLNTETEKCIPSDICYLNVDGGEENTCRSTCPETDQYINKAGSICYSSENCTKKIGYSSVTNSSGKKLCLSESQCTSENDLSLNIQNYTCILSSACGVTIYNGNLKECRNSCDTYFNQFLNPTEKICYSKVNCESVEKHAITVADSNGGGSLYFCFSEEECKIHEKTLWNTDQNKCVQDSDCFLVKGIHDGTCRDSCPSDHPFLESAKRICYNESNCEDFGKYTVTDSSNKKLCISQTECISHADLSFNFDTAKCQLSSSCVVTFFDEAKGTCRNACPGDKPYKLLDVCYDAENCKKKQYHIPLIPSESDSPECLSINICRNRPGYLHDPELSECIHVSTCEKFIVSNQCKSDCPVFLTNDNNKCLTKTECTDGSKYPVSGTNQSFCLTQDECENKEGFLFDINNNECISQSICLSNSWFISKSGKNCKSVCDDFRDSNERYCYTEEECRSLEPPHSTVEGSSLKFCLTEQQCKDESEFLFDIKEKKCLKEEECVYPKFQILGAGECRGTCNQLLSDEKKVCVTESACTSNNKLIVKGDTGNYCFSIEECKNEPGFLYDVDKEICILEANCPDSRFNIEGADECSNICEHLLKKKQGSCILKETCEGREHHLVVEGTDNSYCFLNDEECKEEVGFLYDIVNKKCIKETDCSFPRFIIERKECREECNHYLDSEEKKCFTKTECEEKSGPGVVYQPVEGALKRICLNEEECRKKEDFLFDFGRSQCIKETDCPEENFIVQNERECSAGCNFFLSHDGKTCQNSEDCEKLGKTPIKKLCLDQEECVSKEGFLFHHNEKNCIQRSECGQEEFIVEELGECRTTCKDLYLTKENKCLTKTECKNSSNFLVIPDQSEDQKYCLSDDECKGEEKFIIKELGECRTTCKDLYLTKEDRCLTKTECENSRNLLAIPDKPEDQKYCLSDDECKKEKYFYFRKKKENDQNPKKICITQDSCIKLDEFISENECVTKCPLTKKYFNKNKNCLEKCPEGQFGQIKTFECVIGELCKLPEGLTGLAKGNTQTGDCNVEFTDEKVYQESDFYEIEKTENEENIFKFKDNPRKVEFKDATDDYIKDPIYIALIGIFEKINNEEIRSLITGIAKNNIRRRILQENSTSLTQINNYDIVTNPETGVKYMVFNNPSDEKFELRVSLNTTKVVSYQENDQEIKMKISVKKMIFMIPAKEKINIPGDYRFSIITIFYNIFMRLVAPFINFEQPPSAYGSHALINQNYHRIYLMTFFDFGNRGKYDEIFVSSFKDWTGELSKFVVGESIVNKEIKYECDRERERFCYFKMNRNLIIIGLFAIGFLVGFFIHFLSILYEEKNKNGILFKKFSSILLGNQTTVIFYLFAVLGQFDLFPVLSIIGILVIFLFCLFLYNSKDDEKNEQNFIQKYFIANLEKVFQFLFSQPKRREKKSKELKKVRNYLLAGLVYDVCISLVINLFPNSKWLQVICFLILEVSYLAIIISEKPFSGKNMDTLFLAQRLIFLAQGVFIVLLLAFSGNSSSSDFFQWVILILSWTQLVVGCITFGIGVSNPDYENKKQKYKIIDLEDKAQFPGRVRKPRNYDFSDFDWTGIVNITGEPIEGKRQ